MMSAPVFWGVVCGGLYFLVMWWIRSRRLAQQRQATRTLYALSEQIVTVTTPAAIALHVAESLPSLLDASSAELYLLHRGSNNLRRIATAERPEPAEIPLNGAATGLGPALVACFRNAASLSIADTRSNALVKDEKGGDPLPRAAFFTPLVSHEETLGVAAIYRADRAGAFRPEQQSAAQHVANQIASALKLQEQQALREQLFRGEKLAATGQMIAGIASELRTPLSEILRLNRESLELLKRRDDIPTVEQRMGQMGQETERVRTIVTRLLGFHQDEAALPRELGLSALLQNLAHFRQAQWQERGITPQNHFDGGPLPVLGSEKQLEQVFLTLLMHVEQRTMNTPTRAIAIKTTEVSGFARVEIGFTPLPAVEPLAEDSAEAGLGVCRGIVENHGGQWKLHRRSGVFAFEITLPCVGAHLEAALPAAVPSLVINIRPLTLMLVDPEPGANRPLLKLLSARGHRVIPVAGEEAAEVAPRLRFDAVFWSARPGRGSWGEFLERVRASIKSFVVVSDGYNQDLASSLEQNGGFLLARPVEEASLDRILAEVSSRSRQ